jgi:hypothetical protein
MVHVQTLEFFEFAEAGTVGGLEAEVVALVALGILAGVGVGEGVLAGGIGEEGVLELEDAVHIPGGDEDALEGEVLEEAGGIEGVEEFVAHGVEQGLVGLGDDRLVGGEAVTGGVAGRGSLACGRTRSGVHTHDKFSPVVK